MDQHEYDDKYFTYPDSPVYCTKTPFVKCVDSNCNDDEKYKVVDKCANCQVWRWRFVQANNILPGDMFLNAAEAESANEQDIKRTAQKKL